MPTAPLIIPCPAKVNLALSVGAPNAEGMHPICSWMAMLEFGDTLTLARTDGPSSFDIRFAKNAPRAEAVDWPLENDLAVRAHKLLEAEARRELPVRAELVKRIPTGAGLGGGSSDAAAMLVGVDHLFGLGTEPDVLQSLAARLGSDVIFMTACLASGSTAALVGGLGDRVEPAPMPQPLHLVLVLPPHHSPTGAVYQAFDEIAPDAKVRSSQVLALIHDTPLVSANLFNDLAPAAERVTPALRDIREALSQAIDASVHLTGSGAAMFAVASSVTDAQTIAQRITEQYAVPTVVTKTA